jgi:hypothetical protein
MSTDEQNAQFVETKRRLKRARFDEAMLKQKLLGVSDRLKNIADILSSPEATPDQVPDMPGEQQVRIWVKELRETSARVAQLAETVRAFEENL